MLHDLGRTRARINGDLFYLDDPQWQAIQTSCLSVRRPGRKPVNSRLVLSGIIHVLQSGISWRDCPPEYGPYSTVFNYYNQLRRRGQLDCILRTLSQSPKLRDITTIAGAPLSIRARAKECATPALPCDTCAVRHTSLCRALLGERQRRPLRQAHRSKRAGTLLYRSHEKTSNVTVICSGWGARIKSLPGGRQQILGFVLPGDLAYNMALFGDGDRMGCSLLCITELHYCHFRRSELRAAILERPDLLQFFGNLQLAGLKEANQLAIDLGSRPPRARIARLIMQLRQRLMALGLVYEESFAFPLCNQLIAHAIAATPSDVKAIVEQFRADKLIDMSNGRLTIADPAQLVEIADLA